MNNPLTPADAFHASDEPLHYVLDEAGVNVANAQLRKVGDGRWVYVDDFDGYSWISDEDRTRLVTSLLAETERLADEREIDAILGALNGYEGDNIWEDVVRETLAVDLKASDALGAEATSDVFVVREIDGWRAAIVRYRSDLGRWDLDTYTDDLADYIADHKPAM